MPLSFIASNIIGTGGQPSKKQAIAAVRQAQGPGGIVVVENHISGLYGPVFEEKFQTALGVRRFAAEDLIEVTINPLMVATTQRFVEGGRVVQMIRLPARRLDMLAAGWGDPVTGVIVLRGPHGYLCLDGHHRLTAYYYMKLTICPARLVRLSHPVYEALNRLYREFNFIDNYTKGVYS